MAKNETVTPVTHLIVKGARMHNLKNVDLSLPKNKLVVFTGLSGSGKSSMAFDTIYAEGQRRYVESLSSYARQFLGVMDKPDVDKIEGLSPAISIDQKATSSNPRSVVGTVTEIYDYLRLLFARVGHPHCPNCGREVTTSDAERITEQILQLAEAANEGKKKGGVRMLILSPIVRRQKGQFKELFSNLSKKGFVQARVDGQIRNVVGVDSLIKTNRHDVEAVIDRIVVGSKELQAKDEGQLKFVRNRIFESVETALELADGLVIVSIVRDAGLSFPDTPKDMEDHLFSEKFACAHCNIAIPEIEPRSFSFNSPEGACETCMGLGSKLAVKEELLLAPVLTLSEGGIVPLASQFESDTWYSRLIKTVAREHGFDEKTPLRDLKAEQMKVLLYGTGKKVWPVRGTNTKGRETIWDAEFRGVIPELERRYEETSSEYVRSEMERYMVKEECPACHGDRLKPEALSVTVGDKSIADISRMPIDEALDWNKNVPSSFSQKEKEISGPILEEIVSRLSFLVAVGLEYLSLGREAGSLAGGELQRIRLASQIGSRLTGILYVLDEPTIGLHERDNKRLIKTLRDLQSLGNTLIVVEHDKEMMLAADEIVEFGPAAGNQGGEIVFQGDVKGMMADSSSLTGAYLSGRKKVSLKKSLPNLDKSELVLRGAEENNLKQVDLKIPLGRMVGITGVSGSGKSTLVVQTLYEAMARQLNKMHRQQPVKFESIMIPDEVKRVSLIDQSPIGRTPRSNPATYTKAFDYIRNLYAQTEDARLRGYKLGRFSFNVKGGRCEACQGEGQNKIEMQFMSDIYVSCEVCQGLRYNQPTLEVEYKGKNIAQVLSMTVDEAADFFRAVPGLYRKLETLQAVGLGYIQLGQPAPTLSGGEAQRVKLASELSKVGTGHTVYILDEPTTGLHFEDLQKLMHVLRRLVEQDNTVVVIEHNLDLVANADWLIDMGPEGGAKGGEIVVEGNPDKIMQTQNSYTGMELKEYLSR